MLLKVLLNIRTKVHWFFGNGNSTFRVFLTILVIIESQYPSMFVRTFVTKFSKMMRIQ